MMRNSDGCMRTRMGPFSIRKPPSTAPKTTTIPIIANMRRFPRLIRTLAGRSIARCGEFELVAEVLNDYRQRARSFPETKGSGRQEFEQLKFRPIPRGNRSIGGTRNSLNQGRREVAEPDPQMP